MPVEATSVYAGGVADDESFTGSATDSGAGNDVPGSIANLSSSRFIINKLALNHVLTLG